MSFHYPVGLLQIISLLLLAGGLIFFGVWHWRPTIHETCCARCGYPVRGLPSSICPECGSDLRGKGTRHPGQHRQLKTWQRMALWTLIFPAPAFLAGRCFVQTYPYHYHREFRVELSGPRSAAFQRATIVAWSDYKESGSTNLDRVRLTLQPASGSPVRWERGTWEIEENYSWSSDLGRGLKPADLLKWMSANGIQTNPTVDQEVRFLTSAIFAAVHIMPPDGKGPFQTVSTASTMDETNYNSIGWCATLIATAVWALGLCWTALRSKSGKTD